MKRRILALLLAVILLFSAAPTAFAGYTPQNQLELLYEVDGIIRKEGLESSPADQPLKRAVSTLLGGEHTDDALLALLEADPTLYEQLLSAMLSGYDRYTMYLPAGTYSAVYQPETNYVGVGVTLLAHPDGAQVTDVNLMGSAAAAGIRPGDILTHADGTPLAGMDVSAISDLLRGPEGTSVAVTLSRDGAVQTVTLQRTTLGQLNYSCAPLSDKIFYMKWSRIDDDGSYMLFRMHLNQLVKDGFESVILDLRGNPGGSLDLAFHIASDFFTEKTVFFRTVERHPRKEGELMTRYITAQGDGVSIPNLFVLVDGDSASAAEIIACGLREGLGATVIGQNTFGKARAQQHYILNTDAGIVLTIMQLLPLEGEDYQDVGLTPDVKVENHLRRTTADITVPTDVALAPYSCSDNGEALNRALVELGLLERLPEKPYQVGDDTLYAIDRLQAVYQLPDTHPGVGIPSLLLVNRLLEQQRAGLYEQDAQLDTAIRMAGERLNAR
ncbi:MAG: PDZ domain-containing protein [Clostridia bacterium]|nr:PDZ domain-containing protein [Clostridia bacterium]